MGFNKILKNLIKVLNSLFSVEQESPKFNGKIIRYPHNKFAKNWRGDQVGISDWGIKKEFLPKFYKGRKVRKWVELSQNQDDCQNDTIYYGPLYYTRKKRRK